MHSDKTPDILGNGSYGCIFYPSINVCNGKKEDDIDSDHYITKIQKHNPEISDEVALGKIIKNIHLYDHYFAPIVKHCFINTTNMDYDLVKTCTNMQNDFGEFDETRNYISNKIRYVGQNTISKYFYSMIVNPKHIYRKLINTHLHLLDAVKKLYDNNIVHFDLKSPNIMYDDIQNVPIIIDFGISKDITPLINPSFDITNKEYLLHKIFINDEPYLYWCIDIYILSNIGYNSYLRPNSQVRQNQFLILLDRFVSKNNFMHFISMSELTQFKENIIRYFNTYIEQQRTWEDVFRDLIQNYTTWDNYSLALCYTRLKCIIDPLDEDMDTINTYKYMLNRIILSMPDKRPTAEETKREILSIL